MQSNLLPHLLARHPSGQAQNRMAGVAQSAAGNKVDDYAAALVNTPVFFVSLSVRGPLMTPAYCKTGWALRAALPPISPTHNRRMHA